MLTPRNVKKIRWVRLNDIPEVSDSEVAGDGIGAFTKLDLPFIQKVLSDILGIFGVAAATGAVSGATQKATSGASFKIDNDDLTELVKFRNMMEQHGRLDKKFKEEMNRFFVKQKG